MRKCYNKNFFVSFSDTVFVRYDPSKNEHEKYEIKAIEEDRSNIEEHEDKKINVEDDKPPEVSSETFYQVDQSLKSLFSNTSQVYFVLVLLVKCD